MLVHRDNTASLRVPPRAGSKGTGELRDAPARLEQDTGPVYVVFAWSAE